jgi:hypothetical protein
VVTVTVSICTVAGDCITCSGSIRETRDLLEKWEKEGRKYICCGTKCVRIDQISIVEEEVRLPDDEDGHDRPIFGNPEVLIITGGGRMALQRSSEPPEAEPTRRHDEGLGAW